MNVETIRLERATLTRVGYLDSAIPPGIVGLDAAAVTARSWHSPRWCNDGLLRVGAAAWFADVAGKRLVFDPLQAADYALRADRDAEATHQTAVAAAFAAAGLPRESVDMVVMTHIEGVGMVAERDGAGAWSRYFPHARVLVSEVALTAFERAPAAADNALQHEAWHALLDLGVVDSYRDGELAAGVVAEVTHGHCPGHAVVHFREAAGVAVTMLGHLAVSPLHLASGECAALHAEPAVAWTALQRCIADDRILIGPLWPTPGYGRWCDQRLIASDADGAADDD